MTPAIKMLTNISKIMSAQQGHKRGGAGDEYVFHPLRDDPVDTLLATRP